ncbi:hypothetical protein [Flavobacterium sp. WC2430]|uniref:hypothetical protein n=1 Tax=Flavobacterium sp. WC2430 TaxID=3234137 RepID=UPI0034674B9C
MKTIKILITALLMVLSVQSFSQAKGEAWFYATDFTNKTMYLTELQNVVIEEKYNNPDAWRYGFVELMGWQNRVPNTYFVAFKWMSTTNAKWYASEVESRNFKINDFKSKGYTIKYISMPAPKNPPQKQYNASKQ